MATKRRLLRIGIITASAIVALGVTAAIAGPYIYRDFIAKPAAEAPRVAVAPQASASIDSADLSGEWKVGKGSYAGYRVDEVLNGVDVTVTGRTKKVTGTFTVDGLTLTKAKVVVDVASIATDEPNRDNYFRSNAMEAYRYPEATFELTEPVQAQGEPKAGEAQTYQVQGEFTLHGVTRTVTAEVQVALDGDGGQLGGSVPVTFSDYDITAPSLGFVTVEPSGKVEFLLQLERN